MIWIFPIAGYGTRTSTLGSYKPFIEIFENYKILKICLMGIKSHIKKDDKLLFIASREQETQHDVSYNVQLITDELGFETKNIFSILDETPKGQALTIKHGLQSIEDNLKTEKVFVVNSDQMVAFDFKNIDFSRPSAGLYFATGDKSCFYKLDFNSKTIIDIKEKQKISCYASAGVFYFNTIDVLLRSIEWAIQNKKTYNGELYLGPCMEYFANLSYFPTTMKFDLGNVKSIEFFKSTFNFWEKDK
jgi:hypothetical protein